MIYKEMPQAFESIVEEPGDIDTILEILKTEGLQPVPPEIRSPKVTCIDAGGNKFLMKPCSRIERSIFTGAFPLIGQQELAFRTLQFPTCRNAITRNLRVSGNLQQQDFIIIPFYEGERFNDSWDEISPFGYGGRGINRGMAGKIVDLLADLSLVSTDLLTGFNLPTFDFSNWKAHNFPYLSEILTGRSILSRDQVNAASLILTSADIFKDQDMMLTNGDFYPRNFIVLPDGKITIVDWEGRQDYSEDHNLFDQRNALINYPVNNVAFLFVHMWGNYDFQKDLVRGATKEFHLTPRSLQAAFLIKSLEQSIIWPDDLARRQAEIFVNALNIGFIGDFM